MSSARDDIFSLIGRFFLRNAVEPDSKGETSDMRPMLALIGILGFVGNEAVKILFRRNFGMSLMAWVRVVICTLCFAILSIVSFVAVTTPEEFNNAGTKGGHLFSGFLFAILTFAVLIKGIMQFNKKADPAYSGESNILGFLSEDGWRKKTIQNLFEPVFVLTVGITLCLFDYIGGSAIIFCALSVWLNALFDLLFSASSLEENMDDLNSSHHRKGQFNKAR